jgi:HAE1 family hydrophobic/amphiphilic exporter-1
LKGRNEIGMAAMAITAADIVVYTPVAFMSGLVGQLFRQYGLTVVAATIFSFLVSFTLTPMLASRWLKHEEDSNSLLARYGRFWDRGFNALGRAVERIVPLAVGARWVVVLLGLGLVAGSAMMIQTRMVGTEYAPAEDSDSFQVNVNLPAGSSLEATDTASLQMEQYLQAMPEVQYVFSSVSVAGSGITNTVGGSSRISVQLTPKKERERSVFDIVQQVRQFGRNIPDTQVAPNIPSSFPGGGGSGGLSVDVNGPDVDVLNTLVLQLEDAVAGVPGLADVRDSSQQGTPEVQIIFDRARMAQLGVTTQQATTSLRTTLGGLVVTQFRRPGKLQEDITVIAGDVDRTDLNRLASIPVKGTSATTALSATAAVNSTAFVTLGQIATIKPGTGPVQIQRQNRNRTISINGTAVGRPLGDVASDMQTALNTVPVPAGYTVKPGRSVSQFTQALMALLQALVLSLLLEYMLLVALYESWFYPFVLILSVPLGLVGSIAALWATGNTINVFSMMGLIMAFGLVAKNGILLVDFTNLLRKQGVPRTQALAQAARTRLRPILMTSSTMIFGMLPLTLKSESGAESRAPMAVVVIGAVVTSTLLAVIVLPAVYTLFDDLQGLLARRPAPAPAHVPELAPAPVPALAMDHTPAAAHRNGARHSPAYYIRRAASLRDRRREARARESTGGAQPTQEPA